MKVTIQSRSRIFPEVRSGDVSERVESLSILDAAALNFSISGCVFFYDQCLNANQLLSSLSKTLNAYPQWAGQLRYSKYSPKTDHKYRQGRLELAYGSITDPGVECTMARADCPLSTLIPPLNSTKMWDATAIDYQQFLDMETPFGLNVKNAPDGVPSMKVQFTTFASQGLAVAIGLLHPLADAQTLLRFTHDWAATNRAAASPSLPPALAPLFKPSLLDAAAAGNIDASIPESSIFAKASKLPLHRFDYWASSTPACPEWALSACEIPLQLKFKKDELVMGPPIPWETWDMAAPVSHIKVFFTAAETHAIYRRAAAHTESRISHQDALLAEIWAAIIRARDLGDGKTHYMDVSIDVRRRLQPQLPTTFLGSPIINAACATSATCSTVSEHRAVDVSGKAACIRKTIQKFDAENMAALLHEMAFELGAQRRWNCFLGDEHIVTTSWIGIGLKDIVFEADVRTVWVEALLPSCEAMLQIAEGIGGFLPRRKLSIIECDGESKWWVDGVTVSVWLKRDVMARLIADENFHIAGG